MKLSIIIVNYHVENDLFECIKSIQKFNKNLNSEIIVVDNDEEKTIEKDLSRKFPKVKYVKSPGNIGYGAGNNLGLKFAKGEFLIILNPDTKMASGSLRKILSLFEDKKIGIVAPILINNEGDPYELQGTKELTPKRAIFSLSFISKLIPKNKIYKDYYMLGWNKNKIKEVDVVPGTAFIIKKDLFEKVGGFDSNFFLFFEEFDLCKRIRELGYKIYISPSLKVFHKWGASTAKNNLSEKNFKKSRFYYFKKNYGSMNAIFTETILRLSMSTLLIVLICIFALFLRFYKLPEIMPFIPDIGWFYVSAKDMLLSHEIPLVGIASSHSWLHQGALWTYVLGAIFVIFSFNPIVPAYFTATLDILTLILIYYFSNIVFGKKTALLSSIFYATSPLIIFSSQTPYHTSLIPFFTVLLLISIYKWIGESKILFFYLSLFFLAILYNLELASFSLIGTFLTILTYGIIKRKIWTRNLFKTKNLFLSALFFLIPMTPMLLYDLSHGFPQTIKFLIWVIYRIAVFLGYPSINPNAPSESWNTFFQFIFDYIGRFYFIKNEYLALVILSSVISFGLFKWFQAKFKNTGIGIVLAFFIIPAIAYISAKTNSAAYLPMFFPQAAIFFGYFFGSGRKVYSLMLVALIIGLNLHNFDNRVYFDLSFQKRVEISKNIVERAKNQPYNLTDREFRILDINVARNYEYLTWWYGNSLSKTNQNLKYYVEENSGKIVEKITK